MSTTTASRGSWLGIALALLALLLLAVSTAPAADARTTAAKSPVSTRIAVSRLAARSATVCAVAKRPASSFATRRTCSTLRRRLAVARRAARPLLRKPAVAKAAVKKAVVKKATAEKAAPAAKVVVTSTAVEKALPAVPAATQPAQAAAPAGAVASPAASAPVQRLYAPSSPFNTPIGAAPRVPANSSEMVSKSLLPYVGSANFANTDDWGIAIVHADASDPQRSVGTFEWGYGADIDQPLVRISDGAQPTTGSDHHLAVFDGDRELDMWVAEQRSDGSWMSGARTVTSRSGSGVSAEIGGNAAGLALAAGLITPEEISRGRIDHALQFTSPYVRSGFVAPAIHGDGRQSDPDAMPMGTRVQLDPATDITGLPRAQRIMAQALKEYGAYLMDSSGSLAIRGEASIGRASQGGPSDIWSPVGVTDASLRSIPWARMRVVEP